MSGLRNRMVGGSAHQNRTHRRKSRAGGDHEPKSGHLGDYFKEVLTAQYCFSSTGIIENLSLGLASHWGEISYSGGGVGGRPTPTLRIPNVKQALSLECFSKW